MARRRLPDIGETFTTPVSGRVFTCVGHQPHLNQRGDDIRIPIWTIRCITCREPFTRTCPKPKVVRCKRCIGGFNPATATDARRSATTEAWKARLSQRANEGIREKPPSAEPPQTPSKPRQKGAVKAQKEPSIGPAPDVFTD